MTYRSPRRFLWLAVLALSAGGCSPSGPPKGVVTGVVTLDGKPLADGSVRFVPVAGDTPTASAAIKDGRFTATVPVTKMRVEISAPKVIGKRKMYDTPDSPVVDDTVELLPAKYNVRSTLTLDVKAGTQEVTYEVTSK